MEKENKNIKNEGQKNQGEEEKKSTSSFKQMLTGAVPIEEEYKVDLGHDYDGIRELDNPMPPWWLGLFIVTIIFAIIYPIHYHFLGTGDLQKAEYEKSIAIADAKVAQYMKDNNLEIDESNVTLLTGASDLEMGEQLYQDNCAVCHTPDGRGEVGPNLTDEYWIYGGEISDIFAIIKEGTKKGMPGHKSKFSPLEMQQVSSFVLSLDEVTEAEGGKAPEGEK